jgi:hypothetical protein
LVLGSEIFGYTVFVSMTFTNNQGVEMTSLIGLRFARLLVAFVLATLFGCGGGGGDSASTLPAPAVVSLISITPSLGRFSQGTQVDLLKLDGSLIASGVIGANGQATINFANFSGPAVVKLRGSATSTFFDERTKLNEPFGAGSTLSAVVVLPLASVGVTPLTNAAAILLESKTGGIAAATSADVLAANKAVADHFPGIADILAPPTIVDATTQNTLDIASPADKYALLLAALANTTTTGTALDVAAALAIDLRDGKLDGLDSTSSNPSTPLAAYTPGNLVAAFGNVAKTLSTPSSQLVIASTPLVITIDLSPVVVVPKTSLQMAKAMFSDLRSTNNSLTNATKTGFFDLQGKRIDADLKNNVAPEVTRVTDRLYYLNRTVKGFESVTGQDAGTDSPFIAGTSPDTGLQVLTRSMGSNFNVWYSWGNGNENTEFCWADTLVPATVSVVKCAYYKKDAGFPNGLTGTLFEMTRSAPNQYSYVATRRTKALISTFPILSFAGGISAVDSAGNLIPSGNGSLQKIFTSATLTKYIVTGTLPPSGLTLGNLATGPDTISAVAEKTLLSGNTYRSTLQGSVVTTKLAGGTVTSVAFDSGSFIDTDETNPLDIKMVLAKVVLDAKTADTQLVGTLDLSDFKTNLANVNLIPTRLIFTGTVTDTSIGGSGQFLKGIYDFNATTGYPLFSTNLPDGPTNFIRSTITFTGTLQVPARPELKLVIGVVRSGWKNGTTTLNYGYGTTSLTGSGTFNEIFPGNVLTTTILSNQDGVVWTILPAISANAGTVTRSGVSLATIQNGIIYYNDGVSESLY